MIKCLCSASSIWSNAGRPWQEVDNAAAYTTRPTFTVQTPSPRQSLRCIFCAWNTPKLLTSCSYREISSYLYDALITRVYAQTLRGLFLGVYVTSVPGALLDSDYLKQGVYKSLCTVMRTGTQFYCTLGQGIRLWNEKCREAHMPFISHGSTVNLLLS